ncbi:deoxynucleotidyltransferase terminal-interacting protein 1 [Petromyzon marinus]|uniref:Deoxynucleotidyltransferase terminal-interacting protein 1 n=1 Tax=Petromyzon marinus TaxID=7757 RepID=A0AAJ7TIG3_PETMA|nr:deoxynucleotidyltransferase terminal-interacting protein 1 [Petromyzon marinus]
MHPVEDTASTEQKTSFEKKPWNIMIKHRQIARRGRRSQIGLSFTEPATSMELLRIVLQPYINNDIRAVLNKYSHFVQKAAQNVRDNVGEGVDAAHLVRDTIRNCLEQAKMMYQEPGKVSVKHQQHHQESTAAKRPKLSNDVQESVKSESAPRKRKGRPPSHFTSYERKAPSTSVSKIKPNEPVRKEGPKWDSSRLVESTTFVLGSRANKALGMGGTRGRIYIKHPGVFKYAADTQDKHWLAERHHMPATGGKMAYLLLEQDIRELVESDEYRNCPELLPDEIKPFSVPVWMLDKMGRCMEAARTDRD